MKPENGPANMDLFKHLHANPRFRHYLIKLLFINIIYSFIVYGLLNIVDIILSRLVIGYQTTGSYVISSCIFFVVSLFCFYFAIKYNWNQLFPYLSMAIAVYFPLVTLSSLVKIYIGIPDDIYLLYMESFCIKAPELGLCGEALAHIVFSMAIRALPLVLSIPYLYWLGLNYLGINNPRIYLNG